MRCRADEYAADEVLRTLNPNKTPLNVTGLAVLADMLLTTHFMTLVLLTVWKLPLWLCAAFYIAFAPIEAAFWSSTLTKIPNGAQSWLPHTCSL